MRLSSHLGPMYRTSSRVLIEQIRLSNDHVRWIGDPSAAGWSCEKTLHKNDVMRDPLVRRGLCELFLSHVPRGGYGSLAEGFSPPPRLVEHPVMDRYDQIDVTKGIAGSRRERADQN